jgi:hypothetical protein
MNRNLSLSIPQPCSEKWDNFTPTSNGGFCSSCSKVVVDFSKMTDHEIIRFLSKKQTQTCGRFRSDQLNKIYSYQPTVSINPGLTLFKAGALSLLLLLVSKQTYAQGEVRKTQTEVIQNESHSSNKFNEKSSFTVRGIVKDEEGNPMPGTSVILKGTVHGISTDADGRFEFPIKLKPGDVLICSFIGYDTEEFVVPSSNTQTLEISMTLDMAVTMGKLAVSGVYVEEPSAFRKLWCKVKNLF